MSYLNHQGRQDFAGASMLVAGYGNQAPPSSCAAVPAAAAAAATRHSLAFQEDIIDQVAALCGREKRYACPDYLAMGTSSKHQDPRSLETTTAESGGEGGPPFDAKCREQICQWFYRVVDHFDVRRDVVSLACSYLDRFLATCVCNRKIFKLAATTSLFMAVKIHENPYKFRRLSATLPDLIRGEFTMRHIENMEMLILRHLSWFVHPPTANTYVQLVSSLEPLAAMVPCIRDMTNMAGYLTELAVYDYSFVTKSASSIAMAALLNAIEYSLKTTMTNNNNNHPTYDESSIRAYLANVIPGMCQDCTEVDMEEMRSRLWSLYWENEEEGMHHEPPEEFASSSSSHLISPASVACPNKKVCRQPSARSVSGFV